MTASGRRRPRLRGRMWRLHARHGGRRLHAGGSQLGPLISLHAQHLTHALAARMHTIQGPHQPGHLLLLLSQTPLPQGLRQHPIGAGDPCTERIWHGGSLRLPQSGCTSMTRMHGRSSLSAENGWQHGGALARCLPAQPVEVARSGLNTRRLAGAL